MATHSIGGWNKFTGSSIVVGLDVNAGILAAAVRAAASMPPPFSLGDGPAIRALVMSAGFRAVWVRADVKLSRWQSAEHFVRSMVGGVPTMLGALAEQGDGVLDAIVAEVADATLGYMDDEGWATPQASNIITALA